MKIIKMDTITTFTLNISLMALLMTEALKRL